MLKLYGVPLSQPFRTVAWVCAVKQLPFQIEFIYPGNKKPKVGSRSKEFLNFNPNGQIPAIDDNGYVVANSPAILQYLCEKNKWFDLYPDTSTTVNIQKRGRINWFLANHNTTLRTATMAYMRPYLRGGITSQSEFDHFEKQLKTFDEFWLRNGKNKFIAGDDVSIADFLGYVELAQLEIACLYNFKDKQPNIYTWMAAMKNIPFHDEVHAANEFMGDLSGKKSEILSTEILMGANKTGAKAFSKINAAI